MEQYAMHANKTKAFHFISKKIGNLIAYTNIEREMFKDCKTASMAKTRTHTHTHTLTRGKKTAAASSHQACCFRSENVWM